MLYIMFWFYFRMYGLFQTSFYFGYMAVFSTALGIMCGKFWNSWNIMSKSLSVSESEKYSFWKLRNNLLLFDQEHQKKLKHLISVLLTIPQNLIYYLTDFFNLLFLIIVYSTISHITISFSFLLRIAFFFFKLRLFGKDYYVNKLRFWPNDFCLEVSVPLFIEVKVSRRQHNWLVMSTHLGVCRLGLSSGCAIYDYIPWSSSPSSPRIYKRRIISLFHGSITVFH